MKKLNRDELNKKLSKKITAHQNLKLKRKLISEAYEYNFNQNKKNKLGSVLHDIHCFIEELVNRESERVTSEITRNAKAIECLLGRIKC